MNSVNHFYCILFEFQCHIVLIGHCYFQLIAQILGIRTGQRSSVALCLFLYFIFCVSFSVLFSVSFGSVSFNFMLFIALVVSLKLIVLIVFIQVYQMQNSG